MLTYVQVHAAYCANVKTTKIIIHRYFIWNSTLLNII